MKPISYVLCYACLMHYLAYSGKIEGDRHIPVVWFVITAIIGFFYTVHLIESAKKD